MKLRKLSSKSCSSLQKRTDDRSNERMAFDEFMDAIFKLDRAHDIDLKAEIAKRAVEVVLDVIDLPEERNVGSTKGRRCDRSWGGNG